MSKHTAIIIDDESSARDILSSLIKSQCPQIEVLDKCEDLEQGVFAIKKHQPDLVFLDIEMPNYAGYEISTFFDKIDFEIIFVTAYDSYAIKAFELAAVDYLLKPIEISRLKAAIDRFQERHFSKKDASNYQVLKESLNEKTVKKIVVQVNKGQSVVEVNSIVAIEAAESYSVIITNDGSKYTYSKNLKHFEQLLSENKEFVRTHKSWIINLNYMKSYSKSTFMIDMETGLKAKLSKYKREAFETAVTA